MARIALYALIAMSLLVSQVMAAPRMTAFDPARQGFAFSNTFHNDFVPALDIRTEGLCGGMTFVTLDYYFAKMPIPAQDYRPANRTALQSYLYNRQVEAIQISLDKWAELGFNPGGARNSEFFRWGLDGKGRIAELRAFIDMGIPVPLGLQGAQGYSGSHYVLAIGYDMGRYKGDFGSYQEDFKIFILDPNNPRKAKQLIPDFSRQLWRHADDKTTGWHSYFVVKNFQRKQPPTIVSPAIVNPVYPNDGLVRELLLTFETGADDLRGGADNVNVVMNVYDGTQQPFMIVNQGGRWIRDYSETVRLQLIKPVPLAQIKNLVISTTFGGGISGDNWDMKSLKVRVIGGGIDRRDFVKAGPYRFSGQAQLAVMMNPPPPTPAGMADKIELIFVTGNDDLRGGNDNVNVTLTFKDGVSQSFSNVNQSARWTNGQKNVVLNLNRAVQSNFLKTITISTTFGGGISGDNWDMKSFKAGLLGPGVYKWTANFGFKRFTGGDRMLVVPCTP